MNWTRGALLAFAIAMQQIGIEDESAMRDIARVIERASAKQHGNLSIGRAAIDDWVRLESYAYGRVPA